MKTTSSYMASLLLCLFLSTSLSLFATSDVVFSLICPNDVYVTCEDELWDLSIYGDAYIHNYNGTFPAGDAAVTYNLNSCNIGYIYRTWTENDAYGNTYSCTQTIHVSGTLTFSENDITWPLDTDLEGCNPDTHPSQLPFESGYPQYTEPWCSIVGVSYNDLIYNFGPTCKKVIRKWSIIDWCQYIPNSGSNAGLYTYYQKIKISQNELPDLVCPEDITAYSFNCTDADVNVPPLEIDPSSCGGDFVITNNSPYADANGADISGNYPLGTTTIKYTIKYGCGKKKYCHQDIIVADGKGPQPYCYAEITTALMPMDEDGDGIPDNGMVEIWAKDLDKSSDSPCGYYPITFSFSPDTIIAFMTFTCDDVGENLVNMYVHDAKGNVSYCTVKVQIQNNSSAIPDCEPVDTSSIGPLVSIAGRLSDVFGKQVDEFEFECSNYFIDTSYVITYDTTTSYEIVDSFYGATGNLIYILDQIEVINETIDTTIDNYNEIQFAKTDAAGLFSFDTVLMYRDYNVVGITDQEIAEEISQCDLEKLINHLMGTDIITNPYLLLAADVDNNKSVDFGDLKEMLQYVSGSIDDFSAENKYVLISADYEFENQYWPFFDDFPSNRYYEDIDVSMTDADFVYIQKGNLCNENNNILNPNNPIEMNVLHTLTQRLPLFVRQEIEEVAIARVTPDIAEFSVYPNPFVNDFQINIDNPILQQIEIVISDTQGRKVLSKSQYLGKGIHVIKLEIADNNPAGIYFYNIIAGKTQSYGKLIKR